VVTGTIEGGTIENILFILTMMYYSNIKFERYEGDLG
jgi:hypothetical protein